MHSLHNHTRLLVLLASIALPLVAAQARPITAERIIAADSEPQNWLAHRVPASSATAAAEQVDERNVGVGVVVSTNSTRGLQATPIVVDGRMYATGVWSVVYALDAKTGKELWTYDPGPREWGRYACCDAVDGWGRRALFRDARRPRARALRARSTAPSPTPSPAHRAS